MRHLRARAKLMANVYEAALMQALRRCLEIPTAQDSEEHPCPRSADLDLLEVNALRRDDLDLNVVGLLQLRQDLFAVLDE